MKILLISPRFPERIDQANVPYVLDWANVLSSLGDLDVIALGFESKIVDFGNFRVRFISRKFSDISRRYIFRIYELGSAFPEILKLEEDYDVVFAHGTNFSGILGAYLKLRKGAKLFITEHAFLKGIRLTLAKLVWKFADVRIGVSKALCRYYGKDWIFVPNPIPSFEVLSERYDQFTIAFSGTRSSKGIELFLEVVRESYLRGFPWRFIWIGRRSDVKFPNLKVVGRVSRLKFVYLLAKSHVLLNLSEPYNEVLPVSILEALSVGTPSIVVDSNITESIEQGVLLCKRNTQSIVECLEKLSRTNLDRNKLIEYSRNFSYEHVAKQLSRILLYTFRSGKP